MKIYDAHNLKLKVQEQIQKQAIPLHHKGHCILQTTAIPDVNTRTVYLKPIVKKLMA